MICQRCGGRLIKDTDGAGCLMCGAVYYADLAVAEALAANAGRNETSKRVHQPRHGGRRL